MTSETKPISSLTILYDNMRWEEKALYESAKKRGIQVDNVNCKALFIDLNEKNSGYKNRIIVQRCVSDFKSLHSTAAWMFSACVVNSLQAATCGNKLFAHMRLINAGVKTPKAISAFSEESAIAALTILDILRLSSLLSGVGVD